MLGGIILSVLMIVSCVSAITVYIEPHQINSGDELRVHVQDLPNNTKLSLAVEMMMDAVPGGEYTFVTSNITMPFKLVNGSFSVRNQNTIYNNILFNDYPIPDDPHHEYRQVNISGYSTNGIYAKSLSVPSEYGTFQVNLGGTVQDTKSNVVTSFMVSGTKVSGGPDSVIPFRIYSSEPGTVKITVMADDAVVFADQVTIGNPTSKTGNIYVSTIPSGANVFIDGILYGSSPRIIKEVPPGQRIVTLTKPGYNDYQKTVYVTASQLVTLNIRMEPGSSSGTTPGQGGSPATSLLDQIRQQRQGGSTQQTLQNALDRFRALKT